MSTGGPLGPRGPRTGSLAERAIAIIQRRGRATTVEIRDELRAAGLELTCTKIQTALWPHYIVGTLNKAMDDHPGVSGVNRYELTPAGLELMRSRQR